MPKNIGIDLVNVSFDPSNSPDRISALFTLEDIIKINPNRNVRLLCSDHVISEETVASQEHKLINELIHPKNSHMDYNIATALYYAAKAKDTSIVNV